MSGSNLSISLARSRWCIELSGLQGKSSNSGIIFRLASVRFQFPAGGALVGK